MKYLLSQDEMDKIKKDYQDMKDSLNKKLLKVCSMVAEKQQMEYGLHGCVETGTTGYCCDCVVIDECPKEYKSYGK